MNDWMYSTLASKSIEDVRGREGQENLRKELLDEINRQFKTLGCPEFGKEVLFDEYAIQ
ncbi:MAG: flagellar basal body-associated FliL family protein [Planctomycetaceae bacterium]